MTFIGIGQAGEKLAEAMQRNSADNNHGSVGTQGDAKRIVLVQDILEPLDLSPIIRLIKKDGEVECVCAVVDPGRTYDGLLHYTKIRPIPVFSLLKELFNMHKQEDPLVAEDVTRGNIVWKPKESWHVLAKVMAEVYGDADYLKIIEDNDILHQTAFVKV